MGESPGSRRVTRRRELRRDPKGFTRRRRAHQRDGVAVEGERHRSPNSPASTRFSGDDQLEAKSGKQRQPYCALDEMATSSHATTSSSPPLNNDRRLDADLPSAPSSASIGLGYPEQPDSLPTTFDENVLRHLCDLEVRWPFSDLPARLMLDSAPFLCC